MNEEVELYLDEAKEEMTKALQHLEKELQKIRAGRADTAMLDGVTVDYYGTSTPLTQVSNVGTSDARTIVIQPWEKNLIPVIEKAILAANLGFNPVNNGELIRILVPTLTEERRKTLVKQVKTAGENAKVAVRNIRRDINEEIKKMKKGGLPEDAAKDAESVVQKVTDDSIRTIDKLLEKKEADIMQV